MSQYSCYFQINQKSNQSIPSRMNFSNLFRPKGEGTKPTPPETIDIEHNTTSIIYKYHDATQQIFKPKDLNKLQENHNHDQELSRNAFSPNQDEKQNDRFSQFRHKSNILYDFEKYLIYNKVLGEGSFSRVYLGEAKRTKKLMAIKQVQKLESNQIACLMNSQSLNIIRLYDFWNVDKFSYIALELCDGNLRDVLGKISYEEKVCYLEQIVEGINYLNKKNIIHRDLKFENILLKNNTVKISDFGFAKPIGSMLAVFSQKCGTPYTMAPQIYFYNGQGKPIYSPKCDIYSLGVIIHEMFYDRHPFDYSVEKMKSNNRVCANKKFGVLDVLIDRCLEQEVVRRCNWSQFMQVFNLFRNKKTNQNPHLTKEKHIYSPDFKQNELKNIKKPLKNDLIKYRRNIYETPVKNETKKDNFLNQKQNPFNNIRLPTKQHLYRKAEQKKPIISEEKNQSFESELMQKKIREREWKTEHDKMFEDEEMKENSVQNEAISAFKLVFLVIGILSFLAFLQKQFK